MRHVAHHADHCASFIQQCNGRLHFDFVSDLPETGEPPFPAGTDFCQYLLSLNILVSCWSRCHLVPVEVERHIVNDVFVVHRDAAGHRHGHCHLFSYLLLQNLQNVWPVRGGAVVLSLVICVTMYPLSLLLNFIVGIEQNLTVYSYSVMLEQSHPKPLCVSHCMVELSQCDRFGCPEIQIVICLCRRSIICRKMNLI